MTLQQLEYIIALARHRQFAKAADACGVTQPTLSAMIQKLEEELGAKIFERRKQPVTPTPVGLIILERAEEILQRAQRLKEAVNEAQHSLKGTFSIGILPTIAPYLLPRFLPQLMQTYPDTDVRFIEMKTAEIKRALDQNEIDAGIVAELEDMDRFSAHTLFYEQFLAYIAESDPLAAKSSIKSADLKDEYLWLLDEGHCFRDQLVKFCQLKAASHIYFHAVAFLFLLYKILIFCGLYLIIDFFNRDIEILCCERKHTTLTLHHQTERKRQRKSTLRFQNRKHNN